MTRVILAALALLAASPLSAAGPLPAWLAGTWAMERGAEWADEVWLKPRGDTMQGMARHGFGPDVQGWDSLRIVRRDGGLVLVAQAKGASPVEFPQAFVSGDAVEFANPGHDFPQRIRYARAGQLLTIEQSRMDGSDAVRTNYRPVETAPDH